MHDCYRLKIKNFGHLKKKTNYNNATDRETLQKIVEMCYQLPLGNSQKCGREPIGLKSTDDMQYFF